MQLFRLVGAFLFATMLAFAMVAHVAPARADEDAETQTARLRFQEGVRYFDSGQYAKARVAFLQAYALKKHPAVLLNLAQSELRTPGHEAIAAQHFAEYLRQAEDDATRGQAQEGLAKAKAKIATVAIETEAAVEVWVDGERYGVTPLADPLFFKPGTYSIEARKGEETKTESVTATAGMTSTLSFTFAPPPPAEVEPVEAPEDEAPKKKPRPTGRREPFFGWLGSRPGGVALGLMTIAGLGTGIGLQVAAQTSYSDAEALEDQIATQAQRENVGRPPCGDPDNNVPAVDQRYYEACVDWIDAKDRGDDFARFSWVGFGVAGASAVSVVVYYLVDSTPSRSAARAQKREHEARRVHVVPVSGPEFSGVSVNGRF